MPFLPYQRVERANENLGRSLDVIQVIMTSVKIRDHLWTSLVVKGLLLIVIRYAKSNLNLPSTYPSSVDT